MNFKTEKSSYKSRKMSYRPQDEWVVFENTQEPIIDTETWHTAQKCKIEQYQADGEKAEQFIKVVKKYTDFTELTPSMKIK